MVVVVVSGNERKPGLRGKTCGFKGSVKVDLGTTVECVMSNKAAMTMVGGKSVVECASFDGRNKKKGVKATLGGEAALQTVSDSGGRSLSKKRIKGREHGRSVKDNSAKEEGEDKETK